MTALNPEQAHTADASGTLPGPAAPATMSDAAPSASERTSSEDKPVEAKPAVGSPVMAAPADGNAKIAAPAAQMPKTAETNVEPAKANASVADVRKDQARPDADKAAAAKLDAATTKRSGPIAVFISRKDGKLYVRQNFAPLFEVPVTIAPSDRLLGTHVFTAEAYRDDPRSFHWSVVTLPVARHAERADDEERISRRRRTVGAVEMKPAPDGPAEALDRITIPEDAMAKITDALSTGSSIIVSDQGIAAGETGEGTDFIVSLR